MAYKIDRTEDVWSVADYVEKGIEVLDSSNGFLKEAKAKPKELASRSQGRNVRVVMQNVKVCIRGRLGCFGIARMKSTMQRWEEWLHRRFRAYIWKQWKTRITNLVKLGVTRYSAHKWGYVKGYWRASYLDKFHYKRKTRTGRVP